MSRAPGYQRAPNHKIVETPEPSRMKAELGGEVIADSTDVLRVEEDGSPVRFYFPRADVRMEKLRRSATTSFCPFKGTANYFSIAGADGKTAEDVVWTYEQPYDEHVGLKDRVAFWTEKNEALTVKKA